MKNKGFTLIEMIISMAVIAITIGIVVYGYVAVVNMFTAEMSEGDILIEMNRPVEQMTKELRNALQIVASSSQSITFWHKDLNENGTREAAETISYSWSGTPGDDLIKTVSSESFIIANKIQDFNLTYVGTAPVSLINVSISISRGEQLTTLESSVQCRNL